MKKFNLFKAEFILKCKCYERLLSYSLVKSVLNNYENDLFKSWRFNDEWFLLVKANNVIMRISYADCKCESIKNISNEDYFIVIINNLLFTIKQLTIKNSVI